MDKKIIIIIVMGVIILAGVGVFAYKEIRERIYLQGFNDGNLNFYNGLIISLSQNGEVILPIQNINNETIQVRLVIAR